MQVHDGAIPDIGSRLRQAREELHLSLRDIADHTKISVTVLDAIEHNDFARLPGGFFRRAFIKAFANEVGLDANALANEYREPVEVDHAALAMTTAAAAHPRPADRRSIGIGVTCAAVIAVGWMVSISFQALRRRRETAHRPPGVASRRPAPTPAAAAPAPLATELPRGGGTGQVAAALRIEESASSVEPRVSARADGQRAIFQIVRPGERRTIDAKDAIDLRVGDAGAVTYVLNGAAERTLGQSGDVVSVRITPENARASRTRQ